MFSKALFQKKNNWWRTRVHIMNKVVSGSGPNTQIQIYFLMVPKSNLFFNICCPKLYFRKKILHFIDFYFERTGSSGLLWERRFRIRPAFRDSKPDTVFLGLKWDSDSIFCWRRIWRQCFIMVGSGSGFFSRGSDQELDLGQLQPDLKSCACNKVSDRPDSLDWIRPTR